MARERRLHVADLPLTAALVTLDEAARKHAQVLRLQPGDEVWLFDAKGRQARAQVQTSDRRALVCALHELQEAPARGALLTLVVCVPKDAQLESIVRMTSELGVHAIRLAHSERSVPKWGSASPKLERLRKIALEACAQSGQLFAPELHGPLPLTAACELAPPAAYKCVFAPDSPPLSAAVELQHGCRELWAVVGPEGGLAREELASLRALGYLHVGLGPAILRVETACVVVSALLLERSGALR